jgi:RND superfamily putative drug exporter
VYRYRYIVIGLMVALCVGGGIYGMDLGKHVTQSGFYDEGSQSVQASLLADGAYGRDRTSHVVAILTPPGETKVDDPQWSQRTVEELDAFVAKHDDKVVGWAGWLRAPDSTDATVAQMKTQDMRQTFVSIPLEGDNDDEILKNYQDVAPDLKQINDGDIKLAGLNPLASELTGTIGVDQQRAEIAAIPLVAVLLFFVFGGVVAASLPAIIGGLTILGALGIMRLVADFAPVHFFAQPVVTLIGLGIAIDYGLFIVSRFREEIAEGYDTEAAVRRTVMTAGRTVVFSAVIIVASSLPLLLFPQGFLKSITYAIIASVMLAAVLSITVLAAILAILGPNVDALGVRTLLRVPFLRNWSVSRNIIDWVADKTQKTKTREEVESGFWGKLVNRVMKRPILFAAPIVVLMIVMIIPLGNLALGGISEKYLPPDNPVRVAQEEFDRTFPGFRTEPLTLVISNDDGQPVTDQQVAEIRSRAMAISGFTDPDNNPDAMWKPRPGNSNDPSVRVIQNGLINRNDAAEKIEELREISPPRGVSVYVGGTPALEQDSIHSLYSRLPLMVLLLISTTTILMFLAFGSLVLPIKAALMSALTLGSTMGILTWMFVDGHGSGLMNYTPQPLMAPMIGLIIAVIYGLSTDYEVFLVSRMVEARDRGMSTTESIRVGTATTGRLITAAALVLAVVAGAFVFSDLVMMKYLAFGLLIALLLDATIVRMFLVPAIMKLLGDDCWWAPKWMKRLQHKIGLGETTLPDELKRPVVRQPAGALVSAVAAPAHPVGGPGASTDDAPTTRFGTAKSLEGKSPEGKSPEGKSPEGKSSEGRDIGSWLSEIRGKVLPRSDRVEPSIAGEPTSVIADPAPVEEPPTTAIPTQSTSLSAEETRAIPVSRPASGDSDVATEQLNARAKSNGVSAQDLLRREGRL